MDDVTLTLIEGLKRLAGNLWWTWNQESQSIFHDLSPRAWQNLYHNAVAVLKEVSDYELSIRLQDSSFASRVEKAIKAFDDYMKSQDTWGRKRAPALKSNPIAYFSMEFGFHETLPIAAGGLGILAGDHARSASDLDIGLVGVSIFYREGYFQQAINEDNWQTEYYTRLNPSSLPIEPVLDARGERLIGSVEMRLNQVFFQAWRVNVGRCPVYLLDTNLPENDELYRNMSLHVYGGDNLTRVMQEILLGVGGVRLIRALGINPSMFHMNEGHVAFLALELMREQRDKGLSFADALQKTRSQCHFTTHTPVAAGHDTFGKDLLEFAMRRTWPQEPEMQHLLLSLGRVDPNNEAEPFCMTVLALKTSGSANAVSELHGRVSRKMWHALYPDRTEDEVPIGHITNGIHLMGWMKGPVREFWEKKIGPDWDKDVNSPTFWERMLDPTFVTDEELWALRYWLRRALIEFARRRIPAIGQRPPQKDFIAFDQLLNADTLTIGFARRFATYKRAPLIFHDYERIAKIATDPHRPVQFIFAGKAHPRDTEGKQLIQHIIHLSKHSSLRGHLAFIENYDVHIARQMVSGCDVWLNTPRRPLEASGTSGQKISCNGGLNFSILDGWWREGYDGTNGFAIGEDRDPDRNADQDFIDSENLYRVLIENVIPSFYDRDRSGLPRHWLGMIRKAMATLVPKFNTWRMVQEYTTRYYLKEE